MDRKLQQSLSATCQCGKVKFETIGRPILTAACYCTSCQQAGHQFGQLPNAPPLLDPDSGTSMVLCRKDRVQCVTGQQYLREHRLKPESPTQRVVAACCNSAMFLDFTKGHWLSMFRNRFAGGAPPLERKLAVIERFVGTPSRLGVKFSCTTSVSAAKALGASRKHAQIRSATKRV